MALSLQRDGWRIAGLALVFVWFMLGGIGHFFWTDAFTHAVPPYVPFPREVALATGIADIAGALGIVWARTRRLAGWALIAYCVCVTPVHIEMLLHPDRFPAWPLPVLWLRLFAQPVLIWIIWRVTRASQTLPLARSAP